MTKTHHEHGHSSAGGNPDAESHRIEKATDEVFSRAHDAVRDVADRATILAQDTLERGRAGILKAERSGGGRSNGSGLRGASPLATALAVGAVGYAIATLIRGAARKRAPAAVNSLPDKVLPAV